MFGIEMEPLVKRSVERVVSQRALQIGSSFPCKICVVGFLCGVCLTSIFLAVITSFGAFELGGMSFSAFSSGISTKDSTSEYAVIGGKCNSKQKEKERRMYSHKSTINEIDERVQRLYSVWSKSVSTTVNEEGQLPGSRLGGPNVPNAPHLENCTWRVEVNRHLDSRVENESFPSWTIWKGTLDNFPLTTDEQRRYLRNQMISEGVYPPWIAGSDEENYPLTRKVQNDIWFHQHPSNCRDPGIRFLVADWERLPGFGFGAQVAGMCGLLAIAMKEKRVLVTNYYNRADHDGCKGTSRSSWSCYFFPETSQECRERAFELMESKDAWEKGIITGKDNYTSKEIWNGRLPSYLQPTTDINGSLIAYHHKMDRRWWWAQAVRCLMRFPSEYTCKLMNITRHEAFGWEAAKMVLSNPFSDIKEDAVEKDRYDIEKFVLSDHKPWIPQPLLSMHVRMGDKACEMKVVGFQEYMHLAERIRCASLILTTSGFPPKCRKSLTNQNFTLFGGFTTRMRRDKEGTLLWQLMKPALAGPPAPTIPWLIS